MEIDQTRYVTGEREAHKISTYRVIARAHRSVLRSNELIQLMSIDSTEEVLEMAWDHSDVLRSRCLISAGYVVEKSQTRSVLVLEEETSRDRAKKNLIVAKEFAEARID